MQVLVYHGSPFNFTKFDFSKIGENEGTSGAGFGLYFSEDKIDASNYGKFIYTCRLELQKALSIPSPAPSSIGSTANGS